MRIFKLKVMLERECTKLLQNSCLMTTKTIWMILNLSENMTSLESAASEKNKALCCIICVEPYQESLLRDKNL